jgi:hypothetical protein
MTQISDEDLKEISGYSIPLSTVNVTFNVYDLASELLSARETIRRLVEVGRAMRNDVYAFRAPLPHTMIFNSTDLWDALLAEMEGNKFETAMKRVLDENKGAWKALGGEEGKGSELTESHGK